MTGKKGFLEFKTSNIDGWTFRSCGCLTVGERDWLLNRQQEDEYQKKSEIAKAVTSKDQIQILKASAKAKSLADDLAILAELSRVTVFFLSRVDYKELRGRADVLEESFDVAISQKDWDEISSLDYDEKFNSELAVRFSDGLARSLPVPTYEKIAKAMSKERES